MPGSVFKAISSSVRESSPQVHSAKYITPHIKIIFATNNLFFSVVLVVSYWWNLACVDTIHMQNVTFTLWLPHKVYMRFSQILLC